MKKCWSFESVGTRIMHQLKDLPDIVFPYASEMIALHMVKENIINANNNMV